MFTLLVIFCRQSKHKCRLLILQFVTAFCCLLSGEPNSANPTDLAAENDDYVIASGSWLWSDVRNDWNTTINGNPEPSGFICEASQFAEMCAYQIYTTFKAESNVWIKAF